MTNEERRKMLQMAGEMSAICETTPNCEECPFFNGENGLIEQGSCCKLQIYFPATWKQIVLDMIDNEIKARRKEIHEITNRPQDVKQ